MLIRVITFVSVICCCYLTLFVMVVAIWQRQCWVLLAVAWLG